MRNTKGTIRISSLARKCHRIRCLNTIVPMHEQHCVLVIVTATDCDDGEIDTIQAPSQNEPMCALSTLKIMISNMYVHTCVQI